MMTTPPSDTRPWFGMSQRLLRGYGPLAVFALMVLLMSVLVPSKVPDGGETVAADGSFSSGTGGGTGSTTGGSASGLPGEPGAGGGPAGGGEGGNGGDPGAGGGEGGNGRRRRRRCCRSRRRPVPGPRGADPGRPLLAAVRRLRRREPRRHPPRGDRRQHHRVVPGAQRAGLPADARRAGRRQPGRHPRDHPAHGRGPRRLLQRALRVLRAQHPDRLLQRQRLQHHRAARRRPGPGRGRRHPRRRGDRRLRRPVRHVGALRRGAGRTGRHRLRHPLPVPQLARAAGAVRLEPRRRRDPGLRAGRRVPHQAAPGRQRRLRRRQPPGPASGLRHPRTRELLVPGVGRERPADHPRGRPRPRGEHQVRARPLHHVEPGHQHRGPAQAGRGHHPGLRVRPDPAGVPLRRGQPGAVLPRVHRGRHGAHRRRHRGPALAAELRPPGLRREPPQRVRARHPDHRLRGLQDRARRRAGVLGRPHLLPDVHAGHRPAGRRAGPQPADLRAGHVQLPGAHRPGRHVGLRARQPHRHQRRAGDLLGPRRHQPVQRQAGGVPSPTGERWLPGQMPSAPPGKPRP
jgi:hypothetical protein